MRYICMRGVSERTLNATWSVDRGNDTNGWCYIWCMIVGSLLLNFRLLLNVVFKSVINAPHRVPVSSSLTKRQNHHVCVASPRVVAATWRLGETQPLTDTDRDRYRQAQRRGGYKSAPRAIYHRRCVFGAVHMEMRYSQWWCAMCHVPGSTTTLILFTLNRAMRPKQGGGDKYVRRSATI